MFLHSSLASILQYVTSTGCKNLTNCPRETWEIEAVMAGASWPLDSNFIRNKSENKLTLDSN